MRVSKLFLSLALPLFALPLAAQTHHVPIMVHDGRIYVNGTLSGRKVLLLVDTGATVSIFPYSVVPKHDAVKNMDVRTAAGTATCARVESVIDLESLNETPISTQVGALYCSVSKFGTADGLLGADVLLNGRYSAISFDLERNEMILTDKTGMASTKGK